MAAIEPLLDFDLSRSRNGAPTWMPRSHLHRHGVAIACLAEAVRRGDDDVVAVTHPAAAAGGAVPTPRVVPGGIYDTPKV